ncbi:MAG: orotidine-5'-phosphate decarboxylase [Kineosporiaceae bacterium]
MSAPPGFGVRLVGALAAAGPVCPGIDPHPAVLRDWRLGEDAAGARELGFRVVEAAVGIAAVVKPQVAFFERYGSAGFAALEAVLARCREAGLLVIADAKRSDIGSSATGYADAWLDPDSPLAADAVTASPYLGYGALAPLVSAAAATGRGVFVLCLTSNPEGRPVQWARSPRGGSVAGEVAAAAAADNAAHARTTGEGVGPVGLVVGATAAVDPAGAGVDVVATGGCLLAPGLGAQGGGAGDLARLFAGAGERVVVAVGRDVLAAGPGVSAMRDRILRHRSDTLPALRA